MKRNLRKFPEDFMFQLSASEAIALSSSRSQFVTLKRGKNLNYRPYGFTEQGALMAASILNSQRAVAMSIYIIRAFVRSREQLAADSAILKRLAEIDKKLLSHDVALRDVYQKFRPLLMPPPDPPKQEIGFHIKEETLPYRTRKASRK